MSDRSPSAESLRRIRSNPVVAIAGVLVLVAAFALVVDALVGS